MIARGEEKCFNGHGPGCILAHLLIAVSFVRHDASRTLQLVFVCKHGRGNPRSRPACFSVMLKLVFVFARVCVCVFPFSFKCSAQRLQAEEFLYFKAKNKNLTDTKTIGSGKVAIE